MSRIVSRKAVIRAYASSSKPLNKRSTSIVIGEPIKPKKEVRSETAVALRFIRKR